MDKFNIAKLNSSNQTAFAAQADPRADETRAEVLNLDESQLGLVGGGDNTPNWQDPPTP